MSRFVSAGTDENPRDRDEEWRKAQQDVEESGNLKAGSGIQEGGRSLYEVLQANKAAKQDAFEESIRLKNQFRSLDEDEVEFLDAVLESTRAKEAAIRKETHEQVDLFRKQQEEAERSEAKESLADDANASKEQWAVAGKKRKKGTQKEMLKGLVARKSSKTNHSTTGDSISSTTAKKIDAGDKPVPKDDASLISETKSHETRSPSDAADVGPSRAPKTSGLGLASYSSGSSDEGE